MDSQRKACRLWKMEAEQEWGIGVGCQKWREVFEIYFFFLLRDNAECFFLSFFYFYGG